ncbi:uncharacterized protein LOC144703503 isoform X2 [Wolffia australiana]
METGDEMFPQSLQPTGGGINPSASLTPANVVLNQLHIPGPPLAEDGLNYHQWAHNFRRFFSIHGYRHHLIDAPPTSTDPGYMSWISKDEIVQAWIIKMVSPALVGTIEYLDKAKAMWDKRHRSFGAKGSVGNTMNIYSDMFKLRGTSSNWHNTYLTLTKYANLLTQYQPISPDPDVNQRYREELFITVYLESIDPTLANQVKGLVLNGATPPTLEETFNAVQRFAPIATSSQITTEASALAVTGSARGTHSDRGWGRGRGRSTTSGRPPLPPCEHCGKTNHQAVKCYLKFGYPTDFPYPLPPGVAKGTEDWLG